MVQNVIAGTRYHDLYFTRNQQFYQFFIYTIYTMPVEGASKQHTYKESNAHLHVKTSVNTETIQSM